MNVHIVTTSGEPLSPVELPHLPRIGDTIDHPEAPGIIWIVTRTHWAVAEGVTVLHLARSAFPATLHAGPEYILVRSLQ